MSGLPERSLPGAPDAKAENGTAGLMPPDLTRAQFKEQYIQPLVDWMVKEQEYAAFPPELLVELSALELSPVVNQIEKELKRCAAPIE